MKYQRFSVTDACLVKEILTLFPASEATVLTGKVLQLGLP
jgi:hypothetical protein